MRRISILQYEFFLPDSMGDVNHTDVETISDKEDDIEAGLRSIRAVDIVPLAALAVAANLAPSAKDLGMSRILPVTVDDVLKASNGAAATAAVLEEESAGECFVCLDAKSDAVLLPCGHGGLCAGAACAPSVRRKVDREKFSAHRRCSRTPAGRGRQVPADAQRSGQVRGFT